MDLRGEADLASVVKFLAFAIEPGTQVPERYTPIFIPLEASSREFCFGW